MNEDIREILRSNLIELLATRHITQKELSEKLNVSQAAVTNWVKGANSPSIDVVEKICNLFDVPISDLLTNKDAPQNYIPQDAKKAHLTQLYDSLNGEGQTLVVDYAEHIASKPQYQKEAEPNNKKYSITVAAKGEGAKEIEMTKEEYEKLQSDLMKLRDEASDW